MIYFSLQLIQFYHSSIQAFPFPLFLKTISVPIHFIPTSRTKRVLEFSIYNVQPKAKTTKFEKFLKRLCNKPRMKIYMLTSINVTNNRHTIKILGCKKNIRACYMLQAIYRRDPRFDPSFRPSMRNPTCSFASCKENIWPDQAPPWFSFSLFHSYASHPASTHPTRRRRFSMIAQKPFRRTHRENGEQTTAPPPFTLLSLIHTSREENSQTIASIRI